MQVTTLIMAHYLGWVFFLTIVTFGSSNNCIQYNLVKTVLCTILYLTFLPYPILILKYLASRQHGNWVFLGLQNHCFLLFSK